MRKVVLIPDSFKGTMSSGEICDIMECSIRKHFPEVEVVKIPVADGGEGSVDCFLQAIGGEKVFTKVKGPLFDEVDGFYGVIDGGNTAIVEMAAAAGLPMIEDRKNPLKATTYGVGQLVLHAIAGGAKKIIMGLGGSATNDAGAGFIAGLGGKFYDEKGEEIIPMAGELSKVSKIDISNMQENVKGIEFVTMCDIDNPLCGVTGASHVFGPQKGATPEIVEKLDSEILQFSKIVERELGFADINFGGAGAAGGMGYAMKAFLGSKIQMGIETVLDTVKYDEIAKDATLVLSGEGKIDTQSLRGKVVIGIAKRTKPLGVPLISIVGDIGDDIEPAYDLGVSAIYSINRVAVPYKEARPRAKSDLALTVETIARMYKIVK